MRKLLLIIIAVVGACCAVSAQSLAQQADSAYNQQDYISAVRLYHQAMNNDGTSAQLFYNLGNAYYRIGKLGRAVLYYRRALNLDPSFEEARDNLAFVNTQILDKPEDDSTFLDNVHHGIRAMMSPNAWAWTAFGLFVFVLACVALYVFSTSVPLRKLGFFGGFVMLTAFIYALVIAAQVSSAHASNREAVIIVPTSNLSTSPGAKGDNAKIIPLHEGTVVEITDSLSLPGETSSPLWYNVKINNSTKAWVRSVDVERI